MKARPEEPRDTLARWVREALEEALDARGYPKREQPATAKGKAR